MSENPYHCWLCHEDRFELNRQLSLPAANTTIFESEYHFSAVDIAPTKIGHVVLSSKRHLIFPEELTVAERKDLEFHLRHFDDILGSNFIAYSHIHPKDNSPCVKHLHFHIIPNVSSLEAITSFINQGFTQITDFNSTMSNNSLLVYLQKEFWLSPDQAGTTARQNIETSMGIDPTQWRERLLSDEEVLRSNITNSIVFYQDKS